MASGRVLFGATREQAVSRLRRRPAALRPLIRQAARRIGWGVADQAMSSLTNFAVNIYIARDLGAVQYGAFSLAYVTYSFALNASRGLATDPLLVRFSGTDIPTWRKAVAQCTGTATVTAVAAGACVLAAAMLLGGATRLAFLALGLTLPGLLLQDSWRFAFFALGRGGHALLNDTVWAVTLVGGLLALHATGHVNVFWFVFAWGLSAAVGAALGPLQARVMPVPSAAREWLSEHRDLAPRYLAEGTTNSAANQLRNYGIGLILGLAALGAVQAANTLMGPVMVVLYGMGLVAVPEAARILRSSPRRLPHFCMLISAALAFLGMAWTAALLIVLPRGLGHWLLGALWRPTYPLVLPTAIYIVALGTMGGAGLGLHALGAAKRSLRAMIVTSVLYVAGAMLGAVTGGAIGTLRGSAAAMWLGALVYWWELRRAMRESPSMTGGDEGDGAPRARQPGKHRARIWRRRPGPASERPPCIRKAPEGSQ